MYVLYDNNGVPVLDMHFKLCMLFICTNNLTKMKKIYVYSSREYAYRTYRN